MDDDDDDDGRGIWKEDDGKWKMRKPCARTRRAVKTERRHESIGRDNDNEWGAESDFGSGSRVCIR